MLPQTTGPTTDAIVLFDREGRIAFVNEVAESFWGIAGEQLIGRDVDTLAPLHPRNWSAQPRPGSVHGAPAEGLPCAPAPAAATTATPMLPPASTRTPPAELTLRLRRADGAVRLCRASVSTVHGRHSSYHVGTVRDTSTDAAAPATGPLPGVEGLDAPVVIADALGFVVYSNASANHLLGDIAAGPLDAALRALLPLLHADRTGHAEHGDRIDRRAADERRAALHARLAAGDAIRAQSLISTRDGHPHWYSSVTNPVLDAQGRLTHTVSVLTDVTDTKMRETVQQSVLEAMAHDRPLREIMRIMCVEIERMAPGVAISILRVDEQGLLHPLAGPGLPAAFMQCIEGAPIGPAAGSCGTAAHRGEPVAVTDIAADPLWASHGEAARLSGMAACWSTPVKASDGRVIGTFAFYYSTRRGPDAFHYRLTEVCTHLCALALERDAAREQIRRQAFQDALTGLPNRQTLRQRLDEAVAASHHQAMPLAMLFVDLDGFKQINDSLGHQLGDLLLQESAARLARLAPPHATVGRRSGDEFALVLPGYGAAEALALAETIRAALAEPLDAIPGRHLCLSASIGVSVLPEHGNDREALLRRADLAVHTAKRTGRNRVCLFNVEQEAHAIERAQLEQTLKEALVKRELALHYQPKVNLRDCTVTGVEALARWRHPLLGEVSPARFIPLAEECGLIVELGYWALREACAQLARWHRAGLAMPSVAVNLSPLHFRHRELPSMLAAILDEQGLEGRHLTVEITENVFVDNRPELHETIAAIRALGVRLSMDDFGTGYSSLSHLLDLPVDELKLDQKFVSRLDCHEAARTLVEAAIRIGATLGLDVVAEGIEDERQRALLAEAGCEIGQGYLFARPMAPQALETWARSRSAADAWCLAAAPEPQAFISTSPHS